MSKWYHHLLVVLLNHSIELKNNKGKMGGKCAVKSYFMFQETGATSLFWFRTKKMKLVTLFIIIFTFQNLTRSKKTIRNEKRKTGFIM